MKLSFRARVISTIFIACVICTASAVIVARAKVAHVAEEGLEDKSRAILSRLAVARTFVAQQGGLKDTIEKVVRENPTGKVDEETRLKVLKQVPIFASMKLGESGAEKENYRFRIFAHDPRNKDNAPTAHEAKLLERFEKEGIEEIIE